MAEVIPFRGLRYNQEIISDLSQVVAPPYDIITPEQQAHYHEKHNNNSIHLEYGMEQPGDNETNNRYTRAAANLAGWLKKRVLLPDPEPSFYFLKEEYRGPDGNDAVREGLIASVKLADFSNGIVLPHEKTHSGPKKDRLQLMQATESNLSPIYCLYSDPEHRIIGLLAAAATGKPDISLTDEGGVRQYLWVIDDPEVTAALSSLFSEKSIYIADGHHRYETALAYRDARREAENPGGDMPYDYMMMYLSHIESEDQAILAIHRFVTGLSADTLLDLDDILHAEFDITGFTEEDNDPAGQMLALMREEGEQRNSFGMHLAGSKKFYVLTAKREKPVISDEESTHSAACRSLDVAVLDQVILKKLLGIRQDGPNPGASIRYVERTDNALHELSSHDYQIAFFLNPTSMEEIRDVADVRDKMPQKSTYFYPKPVTGLVFRSYNF